MNNFYTTKPEIIEWLEKHHIKSYTLTRNKDYGFEVNVEGDVNLSIKDLNFIPVKFGEVGGEFNCSINQLKNLQFSPELCGGDFDCSHNHLVTLAGSPEVVKGSFLCAFNQLLSLEGGPGKIGLSLFANDNQLESLEFLPYVERVIMLQHNPQLGQFQQLMNKRKIQEEHLRVKPILERQRILNNLLEDMHEDEVHVKL